MLYTIGKAVIENIHTSLDLHSLSHGEVWDLLPWQQFKYHRNQLNGLYLIMMHHSNRHNALMFPKTSMQCVRGRIVMQRNSF